MTKLSGRNEKGCARSEPDQPDKPHKENIMSIPVDLPGGQNMHEWPAPNLQAGVEEYPGGGFRGGVLIGAGDGKQAHNHVLENLHELRESAYREAVEYVEAQRTVAGSVRDDRSEHL